MSLVKKIILIVIIVGLGWFTFSKITSSKNNQVTYQTAQAQKGTLVVSVTGSGAVSTANNGIISTQASGVVSKLYAKDGDEVKMGDKIADIDLDLEGQQKSSQTWGSYISAKNNLQVAKDNLYTLQSDLFTKWQTYFNLSTSSHYQNGDGTPNTPERQSQTEFLTTQDNWLASEAKYKNGQETINQVQITLNTAWYAYQQASPTIYAPISGVVTGLSLQEGSVIASVSSSSSNSTQTSTKIAGIKTKALPMVSINLTEIDVPKVKLGDKVTVSFDSLVDKTFTGKVISIDTAGQTSSGVVTYPTVIRLDAESTGILPNMTATANIITNTKDDVLLVPGTSVQNQNGSYSVQVMKNGKPQTVAVEIGLTSDTQTEITSGLSEGDTVVTATIQPTTSTTSTGTTSIFSGFGGGNRTGGGASRLGR